MSRSMDTIRRFYDAIGAGDAAAVAAVLDERVEWTEAEYFPYYSGTWHGPRAVVENLLVPLARDWENFSAVPHEFIGDGERVVSLGSYAGVFKKTGRALSVPFAHVWTVRADRIVSFHMHTDTAKVLEVLQPRGAGAGAARY